MENQINNTNTAIRTLAIIPAISNSEMVPNKTLRKINGQTLLSRAMHSAYPCNAIAVASDSNNILVQADVFSDHLENYPELHLVKLSQKQSKDSIESIVSYVLFELRFLAAAFDAICILLPANPLREQKDVRAAIGILSKSNCDSVVSISPSTTRYLLAGNTKKPADGIGVEFHPIDTAIKPIHPIASINGAIYLFSKSYWEKTNSMLGGNMRGMIMDDPFGLSIEYEKDLRMAEAFLKGIGR